MPSRIRTQLSLDSGAVVVNQNWRSGQLSSIQAAVNALPETMDGMLLFLVDHPLVTADLVGLLIERFYESGRPIVLPAYRGKRGHRL